MTQLKQFLLWQLRDFASIFKDLTIGKVAALLLGAQVGHVAYHLLEHGSYHGIVLYTIPLTLLLSCIAWMVEIQWDRFKRDQDRIMNTLKDTK